MRQRFSKWIPLFLLLALGFYVATVEMRPGRLYYLLNFLLFQDSLARLFLYLLCFGGTLVGLLALLFNRSRLIARGALVLLVPCLLVSLSYWFISGYNFMYADAVLGWNNLRVAPSALSNFTGEIVSAAVATGIILVALLWARRKIGWRMAPAAGFFFLLAAGAAFALIKRTTGIVDDFPALYRVPLTITAALTDRIPQPVRAAVPVAPTASGVPHLFLIVDESITATELTLHQPQLPTTPFLYSVRHQLHNFGIASSFTNRSNGSNIAIMSGTRFSDLPDQTFTTLYRTNIFQFAQKAGYTTYYIDAQLGSEGLQNFMTPEDLKYIDHLEGPLDTHPEAAYYERDMLVAQRLAQLSKQKNKVFAYVVKVGAHWPYGRTYPPKATFFTPALSPRSLYKDRERTLNTYHNSLRWTVDTFWRQLMHGIAPIDSTVVMYTADHGQNLTEAGISLAHASVHGTSAQEAAVPLWLWTLPNGQTSKLTKQQMNLKATPMPTSFLPCSGCRATRLVG